MSIVLSSIIPNAEDGLKPLSKVTFFLLGGTEVTTPCAVSEKDFFTLWNKSRFALKYPCDNGKYAYIKKRKVVGFVVEKM